MRVSNYKIINSWLNNTKKTNYVERNKRLLQIQSETQTVLERPTYLLFEVYRCAPFDMRRARFSISTAVLFNFSTFDCFCVIIFRPYREVFIFFFQFSRANATSKWKNSLTITFDNVS